MEDLVPVHIGLLGHIDHGKTALARAISEKVSTAGLDKHPQAQERGITIDLGFTMFVLDSYLVTLVDAPGHSDLIQSVVAGANIIDTAILTVAADEGPKIQTGEHLVVLQSMNVKSLVVAITKIDRVNDKQVAKVEKMMKNIIDGKDFDKIEYVRVSANTGEGLEELREALRRVIIPKKRETEGAVVMPIDHAFSVRGHGTVVTGTILRGHISINDTIEFIPAGLRSKVRSIQTFGENRSSAAAGDRVGINTPEIDHTQILRGDYLTSPKSMQISDALLVHVETNPLYQGRISKKMVINAAIGMSITTAQIIPYEIVKDVQTVLDEVKTPSFDAALTLQRPIAIDESANVLLLRTDLPPNQMRIIGSGIIAKIEREVKLSKRKIRVGKVQRIRDEDVLVEGLASTRSVAESIVGGRVSSKEGVEGIIKSAFGTRGVVSVVFDNDVVEEEKIQYERLVEEEYSFGPR